MRLKLYDESFDVDKKDTILELKINKIKLGYMKEDLVAWLHSVAEEIKEMNVNDIVPNTIIYRYDGN